MAEAVVGLLIGKLGEALLSEAATYGASLLCTEAGALKGLFAEISKAESWLKMMKAYLHDVEKLRETNNTTDEFVTKTRGLAFRIEDVVDEFKYKLEDNKHGGFTNKMKKRIGHVKLWRRLACKLRDINAELEDAVKQKSLFAMPEMERYGGGSDHHDGHINQTSCFAREEDLVGIKENAEKLKGWLLDCWEEKKSKIITVWGMGGTGKTTLVDHVYKTVKEDFDVAAWVTVSKSYQVQDLLKKIARELDSSQDVSNMEQRNLGEIIRNHLYSKRYILVLDDVWDKDVWLQIMDVFPTNCISRFILTSRKSEVASLASGNCAIMLGPLEEDHSWDLFCNIVFRNSDDRFCPSELQDLAMKFLQGCEGLPLAIACIGRLMSCKPPTFSAWNNVYQELELQVTKHVIPGVDSILKLSFEDLSFELKNCFLYCALFPEDYKIKRRRIIRHWITSGFITEKENKTLEEVAECYLNELVNRSLLQVTQKNEFGRVTCCRMHDVVRHLALERAEEECYGNIYEGSGTFAKYSIRRLSIQSTNTSVLSHYDATCTRAVLCFTRNLDVDLLRHILASSSLLSVLDLQGTQINVLPNEIFSLFNLRFLGLRLTNVESLPEAVGRLQNLEVLDALGSRLVSLPNGVAKLKKLRYLYACTMVTQGNFNYYGAVKMPRGIWKLTGLHALQDVKASLETLCDAAALTELRTFGVSNVTSELSSNLCTAIMNMTHLAHLNISASSENEVLPLEALHLPRTLRKLGLTGQLEKTRITWSHLSNLTKLVLISSKLDEDLFSGLLSLHGLRSLCLGKAYAGKKLYFPASSFPRLTEIILRDAPELNQVEIEVGALESLKMLNFTECPKLEDFPRGIHYLTALEELFYKGCMLKGADLAAWQGYSLIERTF